MSDVSFIAWTGGTSPNPPSTVSKVEWDIVKEQYRWHIDTFSQYWGAPPDKDMRKLFWNWSRYDAHASIREWKRLVH